MAPTSPASLLLERYKESLTRDVNILHFLPELVQKGVFNKEEERAILCETNVSVRTETFLDLLSRKDLWAFQEVYKRIERLSPQFANRFALNNTGGRHEDKAPSQALKMGFELALKERDAVLREKAKAMKERDDAWYRYNEMKDERDRALANLDHLVSNNRQSISRLSRTSPSLQEFSSSRNSINSPIRRAQSKSEMIETEECEGGERAVWEYHTVPIHRVPGYGFGIAVSGGRDNPHFSNGDPSIAISDVLKAGPAEGWLLINDRVISVNGVSLENVDYAKAVQVLRDSTSPVHLLIKRRVVLPGPQQDYHTLRVTLTKNKKKDDFGIVLGCKLFIKEITNKSVACKDGSSLIEGDVITKINNTPTDALTLKEAKKLIENCKEKLQLVIRRDAAKNINDNTQNVYDSATIKNDVNSFGDGGESRNYSNQNLYVQPPIRGDKYRSPPPPPEDKNNLTRMSGRSRGPLMDISLSQLDQPATPLLQGHNHSRSRLTGEEDDPPPRPPPPQYESNLNQPSTPQRDVNSDLYDDDPLSRRGKHPLPDPRFISFLKEGSVGIRLTGGNQTGIFVTAVQPGSPASLQGLQPGDKILKVNNFDMKDVTREEAVLYLLNLQDRIDLIVQYRKDEYDAIVASQAGDSFYIRTHFNYDNVNKSELSFRIGDVFHVVDTLYNGVVGSWQVYRIGRNNQQTQKGIVPNKSRAEELALERANTAKKESFSESRGNFFKRRSARRTKILMDSASKFPSYERITLRHPGFTRPVILLGPLSDVARDKLLKDYPSKFASPQLDSHLDESPKSQKSAAIVRLSAIKEITERGKHAVVDITPNAVDRLNYAQFYPIVIFMRADNKHVIKDLRSRLSKSTGKSSKKLFDHMVKLEKTWSHIFTATVTLTSADTWYKKIKEVIEMQQQQPIWISETKPEEPITDDFLFPMTSRLSYASSPESDLDLATDLNHRNVNEPITPVYGDRRLVKASSDPSIATQEDIGLPAYHGPPPYNEFDNNPYPPQPSSMEPKREVAPQDDQYYSKYYSSNDNRNSFSQQVTPTRHKLDPYNSRPISEAYSERTNGDTMDSYSSKSRSPPKVPPKIDRASKPQHLRSAHERLFGANQMKENNETNTGAANYINTHKSPEMKQYGYQGGYETSSYGSDSYGKLPVGSVDDKNRDQQSRMMHDPYRYTRSTALPFRNKMPEVATPPKYGTNSRNEYKPVPPPKPKNYRSPNSVPSTDGYWNREDEITRNKIMHDMTKIDRLSNWNENDYGTRPSNYYGGKSYGLHDHNVISDRLINGSLKNRCDSDSVGFDSGQGSSLDRNYDTAHKNMSPNRRGGGGYYYNVPPPRDVPHHHRDASGLDLSNRENRGSAFELYKKPNSLHGFSPLTVNVDTLKSSSSDSSSTSSSSEDCKGDNNGNVQPDGHVILGSARGTFSAEGGQLECPKTGVSLTIPVGALSSNCKQDIFFKVCRDTRLLPPLDKDKGEKLLSPLVMCGPHGLKFHKPVELRLPHGATKNKDDWSFALKTSETPTGDSGKWKNLSLDKDDNQPNQWRVDGDCITLLVDHF